MNFRTIRALSAGIALGVFFLMPSILSADDQQSEGLALIKRAIELTDLHESGPYRLSWDIAVADAAVGTREGTDTVTFVSTERWRRDLHVTGYDEQAIFVGQKMYRTRSIRYTPPSLGRDIAASLRNLPEALPLKVLRVSNRRLRSLDARCVMSEYRFGGYTGDLTWCFDPLTGLPAAYIGGSSNIEFSDYKPLGAKFVPGAIDVMVEGGQVGRVVLRKAEPAPADLEHAFDLPAGAEARRWCDDMMMPIAEKLPSIKLPQIPESRTGLELMYEITIDESGNVVDVAPMVEKPSVDRVVTEVVGQWRFKPAMCGDTPVLTNLPVDITRFLQ